MLTTHRHLRLTSLTLLGLALSSCSGDGDSDSPLANQGALNTGGAAAAGAAGNTTAATAGTGAALSNAAGAAGDTVNGATNVAGAGNVNTGNVNTGNVNTGAGGDSTGADNPVTSGAGMAGNGDPNTDVPDPLDPNNPIVGGTAGTGNLVDNTPDNGAGGADNAGSGSAGAAGSNAGNDVSPVDNGQADTGGNNDEPPTLIGDVTFSVPSQTFQDSLSVGLSGGGEIRYTTDGSLPTDASDLYSAELALTETTQLRAQVFEGGAAVGLVSTAIYIARTFDFTSDLPIVIMEGYGGEKPTDKSVFVDLGFMTFEPVDGAASISSLPTVATRAGYHVRGQSSAGFDKTPYRVELWDNDNEDADYPMMGMPDEADWALIGPFTDRSLIRNAVMYGLARDIGLEAMDLRFAEVYINQDGGPLEESDYEGIYAVTQSIKNKKGRVNLKQLHVEDVTEPDITGGYIFHFEAQVNDLGETLECTGSDVMSGGGGFGQQGGGGGGGTCWSNLEVKDPEPINAEQKAYITNYIQLFHDALHEEPIGDYAQYADIATFVNHMILNELTMDVDAYIRSTYYHKDRDGLIKAGPVWDYNFSLGSLGVHEIGEEASDFCGSQWDQVRTGSNDWFKNILPSDSTFMGYVGMRWRELRLAELSDAAILERINTAGAPLANAWQRDYDRWPVGGGGGFFGSSGPTNFPDQSQALYEWMVARMAWLDDNIELPLAQQAECEDDGGGF